MKCISLDEEKKYWGSGYRYIAGIDEAGRGPLAGPLVCAAVVFDKDIHFIERIDDSKKLSKTVRETLFYIICRKAISICISIVEENTIDKMNIYQATLFGMKNCIAMMDIRPDVVLIDGMDVPFADNILAKKIIKGDTKVMSIAAASIIAKVTRDDIMTAYHKQYPEYGFNKNYGYPTKFHKEALNQYGLSPIHRKSYKPVRILL